MMRLRVVLLMLLVGNFGGRIGAGASAAGGRNVFGSRPKAQVLPDGWTPLTFKKVERHTTYEVVKDGALSVVKQSARPPPQA